MNLLLDRIMLVFTSFSLLLNIIKQDVFWSLVMTICVIWWAYWSYKDNKKPLSELASNKENEK